MTKLIDLSSDILCHIFSTYIMLPYLSKDIYNICNNNQIYKYIYNKHKSKIIKRFVYMLKSEERKLLKRETLENYGLLETDKSYRNYIDTYLKYWDYKEWIYVPEDILKEYVDIYPQAKIQYYKRRLENKEVLSTEEYLYCLKCNIVKIRDIPSDKINKEMVLLCKNISMEDFYKIPKQYLTYDISKNVVSRIYGTIRNISEEIIDYEIC